MTLQRGIDALDHELRDASPYPGLRPFLPDEARYFMGRETQILEIIGRLARESCVTVLGGSGSGKSSIVRAGVIPALRLKLIPGRGDFWRVAICTPGRAPIDNLVVALEGVLAPEPSSERSRRIREVLYGPNGLGGFLPAFKDEIAADPSLSGEVLEGANVLIVIDQFEELFREENRGQAQAAALAQLVIDGWRRREQNAGLFLVLAMRTDDLHRCAEFIDLPDVINATGYLTRRLKEDELRNAIVAPVRPPLFRAGLLEGALAPGEADLRPYEVQVVTELLDAVEEIAYDPDHLPLLQHLLAILWRTALERWRREADQGSAEAETRITEADLARALGFNAWGDLVKAREKAYTDNRRGWLLRHCLEHVADELYQGGLFGAPLTAAQQDIARTGFCLMGEVDDRGNFKRRWTTREEIARVAGLPAPGPDVDAFIRRFTRDHRLLWVRESGDMDVSHESLMRNWSRLAGWLTENKDAGEAYRLLAERYVTWRQASRDRFRWLFWVPKSTGLLSEDELDRIEPLLTRLPGRVKDIQSRYNELWAQRFAPSDEHVKTTYYSDRTQPDHTVRCEFDFQSCLGYLKNSKRRNYVRRNLVTIVATIAAAVSVVCGALLYRDAEQQQQYAKMQENNARWQGQMNEVLKTTIIKMSASSLWTRLRDWNPVPSFSYVNSLWDVALSDEHVRIEFVSQIPSGSVARQMGFRPQPIIRAIGLRWPDKARQIASDKIAEALASSKFGGDPRTASGLACAVAALSGGFDPGILADAGVRFGDYLERAWAPPPVWSKARVVACLGPELLREQRDAMLYEIVETVEKEAPEAEGFELMGVAAAATMAAWERPDDVRASSAAIEAAIRGLRQEDPFMAISISRSLVSLIAARPGDDQIAALGELLSAINGLPEASTDPDVLLILAQAFELVAKQHSSGERAENLQPLIDQAEELLAGADPSRDINQAEQLLTDVYTARDQIGIARLIIPLAEGRTGILNQLLGVAGIEAAPPDAANELLKGIDQISKQLRAASDGRQSRTDGLRIGLQGRLLALLASGNTEGLGDDPVDPVRRLSDVTDDVGRTNPVGEPLLDEPQQHFAREGLARAFAALAPSLDANQREAALATAKGALAITGSAEEVAAWATAISNLLADWEDGAAVEVIVDVLKYPTAALTAREPNASEPRDATDILAQALAQRLKLPPVELLHPTDLQVLLDRAEDLFHVGLETRPTKPAAPAI